MLKKDEYEAFDSNQGIFLRPFWKVYIEIKLPQVVLGLRRELVQITVPGQSISNWDLMERLKKAVKTVKMDGIRVLESTLEAVSFGAELFDKKDLAHVKQTLHGMPLKVSGWAEPLKVVCNKVPANWFNDGILDGPCERLFKKTFEMFGDIRLVDIPICDPLRLHMRSEISGMPKKAASFGPEVLFDGYVQFVEYDAFAKCMDALRDRKWMKKMPDGRYYTANVKVDFDRTGHLSNAKVIAREEEKDRIMAEHRKTVEAEAKKKQEEEEKQRQELEEKEKRREEREHKRKMKRELEKRKLEEAKQLRRRLRSEEKQKERAIRQFEAQRKKQATGLLRCVFERIEIKEKKKAREEEEALKAREEEDALKEELASVEPAVLTAPPNSEDLDLNEEQLRETLIREMLLKQQEARMRERLREKMEAQLRQKKEQDDERSLKRKKKRHDSESSSFSSAS